MNTIDNSIGLFITRAQPGLHAGHIDAIKQGVAAGVKDIFIGVGSAQEELTYKNPFTFDERKRMIELSSKELGCNVLDIIPIPDFNNDEIWKSYVLKSIPFGTIITGNPRVENVFQKENKNTVKPVINKIVKASHIRKYIALGQYDQVADILSPDVIAYLHTIHADERLRKVMPTSETPISEMTTEDIINYIKTHNMTEEAKSLLQGQEPITPKIAADIVTLYNNKLVLIERRDEPYGFALPGGFVDVGESVSAAAVREAKEEISVDVIVEKEGRVYDSPTRDPRGHTISRSHLCKIVDGTVKASDDAKNIVFVEPTKEEIEKIPFAFPDHKEMIFDLLELN